MYLCFVVDTNPSMREQQQHAPSSLSTIDIAKCAIEQMIIKFRAMGYSNIIDKSTMLIKSGFNNSDCILSSINTSQQVFDNALKNISCSDESHSLAPALGLAFQTLGKYRVKNGIDNVGKGWQPWQLEQAFVIVITNNIGNLNSPTTAPPPDSAMKNTTRMSTASSSPSSSCYMPSHRWDQKVFVYQVGSSLGADDFRHVLKKSEVYGLCKASGGDMEVCGTLKDLSKKMMDMTTRLVHVYHSSPLVSCRLTIAHREVSLTPSNTMYPSPSRKSGADKLTGAAGVSQEREGSHFEVFASLLVAQPGEWPLPEAHWVDRTVEALPPRQCMPALHIRACTGGDFTSEQLQSAIGVAQSIGLRIDSYEVKLLHGHNVTLTHSSSSLSSPRMLSKVQYSLHSATTEKNNYFGRQWCGVSVSNSNRNREDAAPLCGVLVPSLTPEKSISNTCSELLVLPYNFPHLIPLLKQAKDLAVSQGGHVKKLANGSILLPAVLNPATTLPQKWQLEMKNYLLSVPPYYFPSLYRAFLPLGIQIFISLLTGGATASAPNPDSCISRPLLRSLKELQNSTGQEISLLERQITLQSTKRILNYGLGEEQQLRSDSDTCSELSSFSRASKSSGCSEEGLSARRDFSLSPYSPSKFTSETDLLLAGKQSSPVTVCSDTPLVELAGSTSESKHRDELQSYLKSLRLPLRDQRLQEEVVTAPPTLSSKTGSTSTSTLSSTVSSLLVPPSCCDLLYTWESMRSQLFGDKGGGVVVNGLFVAGRLNATGGGVIRGSRGGSGSNGQRDRDWLFKACGGAAVPRLAIRDMGDYHRVLTRQESMRDPELTSPPADEDEPAGVLRRKLAINFGSPYKITKSFSSNKVSYESSNSIPLDVDNIISSAILSVEEGNNSTGSSMSSQVGDVVTGIKISSRNGKKRRFEDFKKQRCQALSKNEVRVEVSPILKQSNNQNNYEAEIIFSPKSPLLSARDHITESSFSTSSPTIDKKTAAATVCATDIIAASGSSTSSNHRNDFRDESTKRVAVNNNGTENQLFAHQGSELNAPALRQTDTSNMKQLSSAPPVSASLPNGWSVIFSNKHQREYWFNSLTGKSQWYPPTE